MRSYYLTAGNLEDSTRSVDSNELTKIGVWHKEIPLENYLDELKGVMQQRGYASSDEVKINSETPDIQDKLKIFFAEHLHTDEEVRFVAAGSGFFDVRDSQDDWIRIHVLPGDLVVLPAGIYHRFTLDDKMSIHAVRLFKANPSWVAHDRDSGKELTDEMDARKGYVAQVRSGAFSA